MKRYHFTYLFATFLLLMMADLQTALAQKIVLHMEGNQKVEYDVSQLDSINIVYPGSSGDNPSTDPSVTGDAIDITNKSATLVGYATSIRESLANDLRVGFIYCLEGTPNKNNGTQVTVNKNNVAEDGRYMATIENLLSGVTYYFRSFVYQSGLWFYGKVKSFVTAGIDVNFTTGDVTDITCFSAKVSGSVDVHSSYSSLTYGICYGTSIEPTTNDNTQTASSNSFTLQLRQLTGGTIYYYRPYAIVDGQTYYGNVRTFRTLDDNVVETGTIDEETLTVTSHLTIGGGAYSSLVLGVCYGTTEIPTIDDYTVTSDEVDEENNYTVQLIYPAINPSFGTFFYRAYVLIDGIPHYGTTRIFEKEQILKNVLLENYTGQRCPNCPSANEVINQLQETYGNNIVAVGIHGGPLAFAGNAKVVGLKTDVGDEYYNHWGMNYQPVGLINRHGSVDYQYWIHDVKEELAKPASLQLDGIAFIEDNAITIQINAEGKDGTITGKLQVWLIEDSIKTLQLMPDGTANLEYIHNHVFRTTVNDTWGEDIAIREGEIEERIMKQTLEPNWDTEQLSIVAFVYNDEEVLQTVKIKVKGPHNQQPQNNKYIWKKNTTS